MRPCTWLRRRRASTRDVTLPRYYQMAGWLGQTAPSEGGKPMVRSSLRTALTLSALWWLAPTLLADDKEKTAADLGKPKAGAAVEKAAQDTLAQFDKGDPGWKVRMEAWVR